MSNIMTDRSFSRALSLITLLGIVLRIYGLGAQPLSGDDAAVSLSAVNYLERGHLGPTMWNHPGLRNILVYISMGFLGTGVWGLKAVSLSLGSLSVPLVGLLARQIFNEGPALLAAFFLAIDPIHIDFSRQAVHEVYMAFFSLAGVYLSLRFMVGRKPHILILAGISFGLGMASKWNVIFSLSAVYLVMFFKIVKDAELFAAEKIEKLLFITSVLIILPVTVYLLTFIPWFQRGYDISEWIFLQKAMYIATATHIGYIPYSMELDHNAYLWFVKPVAFADRAAGGFKAVVLIGMSNPFVWLLTIPSLLYLLYKGIDRKSFGYFLAFGLFWSNYAPFLLTSRPIWPLTALTVIPYAFMSIAYALCELIKKKRYGRTILALYLFVVIVADIPLYLLATGKGFDYTFLRPIVYKYRPRNLAL